MGRYIAKRLVATIFVVLAAAVVIFTIMQFVPGDPIANMMGSEATAADIAARRAYLGLDRPFFTQLGEFMFNAFFRFDFGISWITEAPVINGLLGRLPRTFMLGFLTVLFASAVAIPLGVSAAIHHGRWQDRVVTVSTIFFVSIPEFWLALMMILAFGLYLRILPSFGIGTWKHYVMPVVAGAMGAVGGISRQMRSSMLEVIRSDYVVTARAKGVPEKTVIWKHMFPNALIPVITVIGGAFSRCVAGTVIIESVFSIPGVGTYLTQAINKRDLPIVRGCVVILAVFTALMMLIIDLSYAYVDPRIKAQYIGQSAKHQKAKKEVKADV